MTSAIQSDQANARPSTFKLTAWWAFGLSAVFILYGGVKIVLSFLDHNYSNMAQPVIFLLMGIILVSFAYAYRELKAWGWYGQIAINGLVILLAVIGFRHYENLVLLILAGLAMWGLLSTDTKKYLFGRR